MDLHYTAYIALFLSMAERMATSMSVMFMLIMLCSPLEMSSILTALFWTNLKNLNKKYKGG